MSKLFFPKSHHPFKIVQFTDLHYGESESQDTKSSSLQRSILTQESPNLVIFTGDLVSGYAWPSDKPSGWYREQYEKVIEPVRQGNYSWAVLLGNHDDEADLSVERIMSMDKEHENSYTLSGWSRKNDYILPVYRGDGVDEVGALLVLLYSGAYRCYGKGPYGCVESDQIDWLKKTIRGMENRDQIPIHVYLHIPIQEYLDVYVEKETHGLMKEVDGVGGASINSGLFDALVDIGNVVSVQCGHDHSNDYYGSLQGVNLAYGRKTGYGSYGPASSLDMYYFKR